MKKRYSIPIGISVGISFLLILGSVVTVMDSSLLTVTYKDTGEEATFFINPAFDCANAYDSMIESNPTVREYVETQQDFLENRCIYTLEEWERQTKYPLMLQSRNFYDVRVLMEMQRAYDQLTPKEIAQGKADYLEKLP